MGQSFQGIRFRLGVALGVALAPILVLSAFQSRAAFVQETARVEANLMDAASDAAMPVQAHLDSATAVMSALGSTASGPGCRDRLRQAVQESARFTVLASIDESGRLVCASQTVTVDSVSDQPWFAELRRGSEIAFSAAPPSQMSDSASVLVSVRNKTAAGEFGGATAAIIPVRALEPVALVRGSTARVDVALVGRDGRVLASTSRQAFPASRIAANDLTLGPTGVRDELGHARVLAAAEITGDDLFVVASAPSQTLFRWALANALAVFILPLLTWIVALACVMLVTDRLVVRWLYYLQRVASLQARGRLSVRPVHAHEAPGEIRTLAAAMDEMVLAIASRDATLRDSLDEKDALLREIHHRVKNNLQIITSLLNMQQRALSDPTARAAMSDTRQRITALSLIYRALYQSDTLKQVNVGSFLNDLVSQLLTAEPLTGRTIDSLVQADPLFVDPDKLAPVALWAVEAISNAQKHAFHGRSGRLSVRFEAGPETSTLTVEDDGPGLDDEGPQGLGRTLMTAFARQLRGTTSFARSKMGGLKVELSFPTPEVSLEMLTDSAGRRNQKQA